jgi:hypothetical protein
MALMACDVCFEISFLPDIGTSRYVCQNCKDIQNHTRYEKIDPKLKLKATSLNAEFLVRHAEIEFAVFKTHPSQYIWQGEKRIRHTMGDDIEYVEQRYVGSLTFSQIVDELLNLKSDLAQELRNNYLQKS